MAEITTEIEEELEKLAGLLPVPIHYNRNGFGVSPLIPLSRLQEMGIGLVSDATGSIRTASEGVWLHYQALMERDTDYLQELVKRLKPTHYGNTHKISGMADYLEMEKEYLPSEEQLKYENSLGFGETDHM